MWKDEEVEVIKAITIQGYFQQGADSILIAEIPIFGLSAKYFHNRISQ